MANGNRHLKKKVSITWHIAAMVFTAGTMVPNASAAGVPSSWLDACILRPLRYPLGKYKVKEVAGVRYEDVFFLSNNGTRLHGWHFNKPGATKTVLLSHGIGGNVSSRVDLVEIYLKAGVSVFIYDYQGYGRSAGKASLQTVVDDGEAAYHYLVDDLGVSAEDLILAGESLGTGVTCGLSKRVQSAALILQSPFSSLSKRCAEVVPLLRSRPHWLESINGLSNELVLKQAHPPLLIVHGERDSTVPVSHARSLYDDAIGQKNLLVIDGAGHTGDPALMTSPLYLRAVVDFISRVDKPHTAALPQSERTEAHFVSSWRNLGL